MGQNLDVTVLVDSGTEGAERLLKAVDASRLAGDRILHVSEITGKKHSGIEDLFEVDDYLTLYNAAFGKSVAEGDLGYGDRIVKRLSDLQNGSFDHYKPADILLRKPAMRDSLSDLTLDRFEALFDRINGSA